LWAWGSFENIGLIGPAGTRRDKGDDANEWTSEFGSAEHFAS
jgi:hypothetical protein